MAGVVVIVLIVVAVAATVLGGVRSVTTGSSSGAPAEGGAAAVESYLQAVADGDAETALSYFSAPPSGPLLTDEALAAAQNSAPLSDIQVEEGSDFDTFGGTVTATFELGGEEVTADFTVGEDDGEWVFFNSLPSLSLAGLAGLDLEVNGIAVSDTDLDVFPGSYSLTTTTPYFQLTGETTHLVYDAFESGYVDDVEAGLTEEGASLYRQVVTDAINACVASTALDPGCGISLPASLDDGTQLIEGTVRRTLSADAQAVVANLQPEAPIDTPTSIDIPFIGGVDATFDCVDDGVTYSACSLILGGEVITGGLVDFASGTPVVRWD